MSIITVVVTCLWFLLVSNFTGANEANVNCLRSIYSQVKDPNGYLEGWVFGNTTSGYICKFNGVSCWHDDENRILGISLAGYGLTGEFPLGIKECSDLTRLDLSRNNFSGPLPSNMTSIIPLVTTMDLSYNQFSGEIPASISNLTFLNNLMLQDNQFTGQIPPQLGQLGRLNKFSVADNLLSGPIPKFNEASNFGLESFADNADLCGSPMDFCIDHEEEMIRCGKIGAAIGAAVFAPIGAFLGMVFFNGRKEKQGNRRHRSWIFHIGD